MTKKLIIYLTFEAIIFIFILFSVVKCNNTRINTLESNINAYKSNIECVTLENNELLTIKQSLILSEAGLRDELNISKSEIKSLNKALNDKTAYISQLKSKLSINDTIYLKPDTVYILDSITTKKFIWSDNWTYLESSVYGSDIASSKLSIDKFNIDLDLDVGITENYKFWVKTTNPYITFNNINSVIVEGSKFNKKEKRLHHGITVGVGFNYGLINKSMDFGPAFIYGLTYSF